MQIHSCSFISTLNYNFWKTGPLSSVVLNVKFYITIFYYFNTRLLRKAWKVRSGYVRHVLKICLTGSESVHIQDVVNKEKLSLPYSTRSIIYIYS